MAPRWRRHSAGGEESGDDATIDFEFWRRLLNDASQTILSPRDTSCVHRKGNIASCTVGRLSDFLRCLNTDFNSSYSKILDRRIRYIRFNCQGIETILENRSCKLITSIFTRIFCEELWGYNCAGTLRVRPSPS